MYNCQKCGRPATNLTMIEINGRRMEQYLCSDCAREGDDLSAFVEPVVGEFFDFPVAFARKKPSKQFVSQYQSRTNYDDTPMPIEKVKLNIKKPDDLSYVDVLKQKLQKAVNEENYAEAAELKKRIDDIVGGEK